MQIECREMATINKSLDTRRRELNVKPTATPWKSNVNTLHVDSSNNRLAIAKGLQLIDCKKFPQPKTLRYPANNRIRKNHIAIRQLRFLYGMQESNTKIPIVNNEDPNTQIQ